MGVFPSAGHFEQGTRDLSAKYCLTAPTRIAPLTRCSRSIRLTTLIETQAAIRKCATLRIAADPSRRPTHGARGTDLNRPSPESSPAHYDCATPALTRVKTSWASSGTPLILILFGFRNRPAGRQFGLLAKPRSALSSVARYRPSSRAPERRRGLRVAQTSSLARVRTSFL